MNDDATSDSDLQAMHRLLVEMRKQGVSCQPEGGYWLAPSEMERGQQSVQPTEQHLIERLGLMVGRSGYE